MSKEVFQKNRPIEPLILTVGKSIHYAFKDRPFIFSGVWLFSFVFFLFISIAFDIMPSLEAEETEIVPGEATTTSQIATTSPQVEEIVTDSKPVRILIDKINVDAPINNPESKALEVLDQELLTGVVHYPGSGDLEDHSNMFLFGHSSGLRVVQNQMFKVFNNLKNLKENDVVRVQSETKEYLYRVKTVRLVTAGEAKVEISNRKKMLTLTTCNNFGAKEERYIVEAEFVGEYDI